MKTLLFTDYLFHFFLKKKISLNRKHLQLKMTDLDEIEQIEKNFEKISSYFENNYSKVSPEILKKSKQIVKTIKSDTWFQTNFWNLIAILLIFLAIALYNWDFFKFYFLYILRIIIIFVNLIFV